MLRRLQLDHEFLVGHGEPLLSVLPTRQESAFVVQCDVIFHIAQDDLPFAGLRAGGMGRYHGRDGFVTFSNAKAVFHQSRLASTTLLHRPYEGGWTG